MTRRPHIATFSLRAAEARPYDAPAVPDPVLGGAAAEPPPPPRRRRPPTPDKAAVFVRVTPESLSALHALAAAEGLTLQDLGVYALNLALARFGREPVVESASSR